MALVSVFDPKSPPYKMGSSLRIPDIEKFFDDVQVVCSRRVSPVQPQEILSASEILASLEEIFKTQSAIEGRPYFEDISRAIRAFDAWRTNPKTQIRDDFYGDFEHFNPREAFFVWASEASKYYPPGEPDLLATANAAETRLAEAEADLQQAVDDIRGKSLISHEVEEALIRGNDALYYVIGNGLTPETPEETRETYVNLAAYLWGMDSLSHQACMHRASMIAIKRPPDYDLPLTPRELETVVLFEGRCPAPDRSEVATYMDHKTAHLGYGEEMMQSFNSKVLKFQSATKRTPGHDPEFAI